MSGLFSIYRQAFSNLQRNVWILSVAMFINRSGSMVLLFTSLYMTRDLHFSIAEAGFAMSFYGIGSVLGSYLGGWLTDRRNYFDIMIASLVVSGIMLFGLLFAKSVPAFAAILFLHALTADSFRPANAKAIALYSSPENRARSVSLYRLAVNLGFSVGPAVGGFVALHLGYKWLFVIDACTSFAAAFMLLAYLPRKQVERTHAERKVLADSSTSAYRDVRYLVFIFLVALYATSFFQIFASVPQYFAKECGYEEDLIGLLLALNGLLVVIIEMPLTMILEKRQRHFHYIIAGVFCLPLSFAFLLFGGKALLWTLVYTVVITFSEILAMPFMMHYSLTRPLPERQGQYSALYSIAYGLANIAAPAVGLGIAASYGFGNMFRFFIVLSCLTALGFLWLSSRNDRKQVAHS